MTARQKGGDWYSITDAQRNHPRITVTVSREALRRLNKLAAKSGRKKSAIINDLILNAPL